MALEDVTPQSIYESLNAIRDQMQKRQLAEQQQQAAAEYARQQLLGQAQPQQATAPIASQEQQPQSEYLGDQWLAQQQRVQQAKQYSYGKMAAANLSADQHKQVKDYVDATYDPTGEYAKSYRDAEWYKNAKAIAQEKDVSAQRNTIDLLKNTVNTISDISAPKDMPEKDQEEWVRQQKASQIKTFLTSLVNSAKGSADAEQANEVLRRSPEIFTYPEMMALQNKGLLNPTGIMQFLATREGKGVIDKFANSLLSDPDAYLEKVKRIHDDLATTYNTRIKEQVINPTSPEIAKKDFGITERQLLLDKPIGNVDVQVVRPEPSQPVSPAVPTTSRAQVAAQILQQRAAERARQQAAQQSIPTQPQDFTGKSGF
jgi:hypothetical protein